MFERQLASLTSLLSPTYEYVFINAPFECAGAPGMQRDDARAHV